MKLVKWVGFLELFLIAVGLSMDAFAVSICKGLSVKKVQIKHALTAGIYFGGFQALMPLIGYLLGAQFAEVISQFDYIIGFVLLGLIGVNMIRESLGEEEELNDSFTPKAMLPLALATSIDALATGITFAASKANIVVAISCIGAITLLLSAVGVKIGNICGLKYKAKAELAGGVVLILIGLKIFLQHFGIFC